MYIPNTLFNQDIFWSSLKWLMILGVWMVFAWGTWKEDRKIKKLLGSEIGDKDAVEILKSLHRRDMRIWLQVSLLLIVVATNDIHHDAALLPVDYFSPPEVVAPPKIAEAPEDKYEKALSKNATDLPFSNITEFNERNGKQEAYIDWLKEHYESWLVTYYYLQKCGKVGADDYDLIHRRLEKDLSDVQADKEVEKNILLAATGSYKEMYSAIPCDSAHYSATKSLYDANMQQSLPAQSHDVAESHRPSLQPALNSR